MNRIVVYSKDKWLHARLMTDLQMSGLKHAYEKISFVYDTGTFTPFGWNHFWTAIRVDGRFCSHNHSCQEPNHRFKLTESNYTKVLTKILGE